MAQILIKQNGNLIPYTPYNAKLFKNLLQNGGAEIVGDLPEETKEEPKKKEIEKQDVVEVKSERQYFETLTVDDLKDLAKQRGVNLGRTKSKEKIIEKLCLKN